VITLLLFFLLFLSPPEPPSSLEAADREFKNMNYRRAIALYESAMPTTSDSVAVFWRLARVWICAGDTTADKRKPGFYKKAESYARRAVRADSNSSQGHSWLAAAIGNVAMFEGGSTKVKLAHAIKREVDRAIALDNKNDVAYSILGSFHRAIGDVSWIEKQLANIFLGGLPDGGYAEAETAFRRAIELAPDVIRNHSELGKVYMSVDRNQEAIREFQKARSLPVGVAMDVYLQREAEELIKELED